MELTLLIKFVLGLSAVLVILVFLLVMSHRKKKAKMAANAKNLEREKSSQRVLDLPSLAAIVKHKKSSAAELKEALDLVLEHYGTITPKVGSKTHPDYEIYMKILFTICRHPNTNKNIILGFNRALEKKNPAYKVDINAAITRGLNSRGA